MRTMWRAALLLLAAAGECPPLEDSESAPSGFVNTTALPPRIMGYYYWHTYTTDERVWYRHRDAILWTPVGDRREAHTATAFRSDSEAQQDAALIRLGRDPQQEAVLLGEKAKAIAAKRRDNYADYADPGRSIFDYVVDPIPDL